MRNIYTIACVVFIVILFVGWYTALTRLKITTEMCQKYIKEEYFLQ